MSSIGSDVKVGKLTVLDSLKFETGATLTAKELLVKETLEIDANCNIVGLTETFATDAELAEAESHLQANVLSTQSHVSNLQSNLNTQTIRIDGLVSSLSTTDASIVSLNTDLVSNLVWSAN